MGLGRDPIEELEPDQIGTPLSSAGRAEPDGATGTHAANLRVDAASSAPPPPMLWPVT